MITSIIRVTSKYVNSASVSIQHEHLDLYLKGQLYGILLCDMDMNLLKEYRDAELAKLLGSAISNGRRRASNGETYYLGNR